MSYFILKGTGKTFIYNTILAKIRSDRQVAIAVATSGIAASLLDGGTTAHSIFKVPLKCNNQTTCNINYDSELADLIRKTELVIWDEAVMAHRHMFATIDKTFKDLMNEKEKFFGNKLMLLGGDFRQILPVILGGNRTTTVKASLKFTKFWPSVKIFKLTQNMRIKSAAMNQGQSESTLNQFADYLIKLGEGLLPYSTNSRFIDDILLPPNVSNNIDELELIKKVFPDIEKNYHNKLFMSLRAILTPKNTDVHKINEIAAQYFPGELQTYLSADSVLSTIGQCKLIIFY